MGISATETAFAGNYPPLSGFWNGFIRNHPEVSLRGPLRNSVKKIPDIQQNFGRTVVAGNYSRRLWRSQNWIMGRNGFKVGRQKTSGSDSEYIKLHCRKNSAWLGQATRNKPFGFVNYVFSSVSLLVTGWRKKAFVGMYIWWWSSFWRRFPDGLKLPAPKLPGERWKVSNYEKLAHPSQNGEEKQSTSRFNEAQAEWGWKNKPFIGSDKRNMVRRLAKKNSVTLENSKSETWFNVEWHPQWYLRINDSEILWLKREHSMGKRKERVNAHG